MSDVKEILKIDRNVLHIEWERQSQLYLEWAEKWAQAVFRRDRLKNKLDLVRARLYAEIKKNPQEYGIDPNTRLTDSYVESIILQNSQYSKVYNLYIEAIRKVNSYAALKEALQHRKKALEALTQLYLTGYFSQPSLSQNEIDRAKQARVQRVQQEIREQLKESLMNQEK